MVGLSGLSGVNEVLGSAQERGFVGPGDLKAHVEHALAFTAAVDAPKAAVDLGSGGGLPGLVLASVWPGSRWFLIEGMQKRAAFLRWASEVLGLSGRVTVVSDRAEEFGQRQAMRASTDLVTARGFGAPPAVAEAGAPLLRLGGILAVSEPPELSTTWGRWPAEGLARAGLVGERVVRAGVNIRVLRLAETCPAVLPRSAKHQRRSALWMLQGR